MPWERGSALSDGTAGAWGDTCIPTGLMDGDDETADRGQHYAVPYALTLRQREPAVLDSLNTRRLYDIATASAFAMPRIFDRTLDQTE